MPLISVVIPSYNCELYIGQTLESILAQKFSDIEIIVVDDGSTDRTRELIASYGDRVRIVLQTNMGVCAARNRGIKESLGRYICLMDHDDYWFPDKLSRQVLAMQEHPEVGVVYSNFLVWHPNAIGEFPKPEDFELLKHPDGIDPEYSGWIYHQFLLDCWMLTSTAMFRKEVFDHCGLFDERLPYSEDWDLWLRISRAYPFLKLRRPTTLYRQHPSQGNRSVRNVDYRTLLLSKAVKAWGLCSHDGRCTSAHEFNRQLAAYHTTFAFSHLTARNRSIAIRSFVKAWLVYPLSLKNIAYIIVALFGWRPKW